MSTAPALAPDREQLSLFVETLFRHASPLGIVSIRSFHEGNSSKKPRISPTRLTGGLKFLVEVAEDDAYRAANHPEAMVFCPPICTFKNKDSAGEKDLDQGLTITVECDARPRRARVTLETILGSATLVVRSGGQWTDPVTGEVEDKLHLHWLLKVPASGEALKTLKQARALATKLVDGDPSHVPISHPIRWPGSWHRKREPVMCSIETANPDVEIDLAAALGKLRDAAPEEPKQKANGKDHSGAGLDWETHIKNIVSGESYHGALVPLAAALQVAGMNDGAVVNLLRGLMNSSTAPRDGRWQARYADIPRDVSTAKDKFAKEEPKADDDSDVWDAGVDPGVIPPRGWLSATQFCRQFLSLLIAPGGTGKTALRYLQAIDLARESMETITGFKKFQRCKVLIVGLEDGRNEMDRRTAAGLIHHGIKREEIKGHLFCWSPKGIKLAEMKAGSRQIGELERRLRGKIERLGIDLVMIDPLIKAHGLEENDNNAMDFVCELLTKLAIEYNIAVDASQHTKKGTLVAGDPDNARGASATRDAGRLGYTLITMTEEEAAAFAIEPKQRKLYVRLDKAKVNIEPPAEKATWFKFIGVNLGNATEMYPAGDNVQTVEPWTPPETWAGLSTVVLNAALTEIDAGTPNGQRYSNAPNAKERAAWCVVQKHCPTKAEPQCREIIKTWVKNGVLYREDYDDPVDRKLRAGLRLNASKRPGVS
jgi:hypothetical protein